MTTAIAVDTDKSRGISGPPTEPVLRQAATFLADLVKQGVTGPPEEFAPNKVGGHFADPEEADGWARLFYRFWVGGLSRWEYSALEEYKREDFRSLNRGLRDHDGNLSMLPTEDRRRAEGLDAALEKAPPLERPAVVYRGRLPDAVLEAFEAGEEETLLGQVFGDPPTRAPHSVATSPGSTAGAPASRRASGRSCCQGGRGPATWTQCSTRVNPSCSCPAGPRSRIDKAYREEGVYWIEGRLVTW